jgi:hypothetical protein
MKRAVVFVVCGRIDFTKQTLDYWADARNIDEFDFYFKLEPHPENDEIIKLIDSFKEKTKTEVGVILNEEVLGVDGKNHDTAMRLMFEKMEYDFVVLAENDLIPSEDISDYFVELSNRFKDDDSIFAVCANYHTPMNYANIWDANGNLVVASPEEKNVFDIQPFWAGWIWGTWKDRWQKYLSEGIYREDLHYDAFVSQRVVPDNNLFCVIPRYSRSQHIGHYGAHHQSSFDFQKSQTVFEKNYVWENLVCGNR